MSKQENAGTGRKGREWSPKFKRTVKGYVGDNFDFKSETIEGEISPAKDLQGIYALGLSEDEIIRAVNTAAKQKLIDSKTEAALGSDVVPELVLMKFVEPYRSGKKYLLDKDGGTNGLKTKEDQTKAIIAKIRGDEDMVEALRNLVAESKEESDE